MEITHYISELMNWLLCQFIDQFITKTAVCAFNLSICPAFCNVLHYPEGSSSLKNPQVLNFWCMLRKVNLTHFFSTLQAREVLSDTSQQLVNSLLLIHNVIKFIMVILCCGAVKLHLIKQGVCCDLRVKLVHPADRSGCRNQRRPRMPQFDPVTDWYTK